MNASCANSTASAIDNWSCQWENAEPHISQYDRYICSFIGISTNVICTIVGTSANIISLRYFLKKSNIFFNAFQLVAICDISICILSVFYAVSFIAQRSPLLFQNSPWCTIWASLWKFVTGASIHLVAIQSILRVYAVCAPFRDISKRLVLAF